MNVVFQTKSKDQNRFTMEVEDYGRLYFQKGAYITSDKELVKKLINHPLKKRGEYSLKSNKERVAQYLRGDEPDTLTEEILEEVSMDGIVELGKILQSTEKQPTLIKIEIEGEPITDQVRQILDFYERKKSRKQSEEEVKEKVEEEETSQVESVSVTKSEDMTAKEAVDFIEGAPREELEDFLSEDESRVTVTRAYNEKMN